MTKYLVDLEFCKVSIICVSVELETYNGKNNTQFSHMPLSNTLNNIVKKFLYRVTVTLGEIEKQSLYKYGIAIGCMSISVHRFFYKVFKSRH